MTDLMCGDTLWKETKAKLMLAADGEARAEAAAQGRKALRVFATTLGSTHWYVRELDEQVKQISDPNPTQTGALSMANSKRTQAGVASLALPSEPSRLNDGAPASKRARTTVGRH
mmetsp:Transcript_5782/g.11693  ORF Transcript_5782/g.11693 Transcript_5782/m.11693 type:complete len:115 (+) Transcript_5782:130-474(+)